MKWNHILDKQPENGSVIIQLSVPYDFYKGDFKQHYSMGMRYYSNPQSHKLYIETLESMGGPLPDFWWIYAKDFPFPEQRTIK